MAQCKAKSKRSGERCKKHALKGKNVCKIHGGKSIGSQKGNKHALKTGLRESISLETMTLEEIDYARNIILNPIQILEEQLRVLKVRELRIMKRIKSIIVGEALIDTVKVKGSFDEKGNQIKEVKYKDSINVSGTITQSTQGNSQSVQYETHSQNYLKFDQALSTIQEQIGRTVERIEKLKLMSPEDENSEPQIIEFTMVDGRKK